MNLHHKGKEDYTKQLQKKRYQELKDVLTDQKPLVKKATLLRKIVSKFSRLFRDADEALFIRA